MLSRRRSVDPARAASREYYSTCAIKKFDPDREADARRADRFESEREKRVRIYVFARERDLCRVCRIRQAESRHELRFRSLGGKITRENCVACCGSGTTGCHGYLQANAIGYDFETPARGAEGTIYFPVKTEAAAEWLKVLRGHILVSPVMVETEIGA
jgi:hypothetical protein